MKIMVISKKTLIWAATVLLVIVAAIAFAVFSGRDSGAEPDRPTGGKPQSNLNLPGSAAGSGVEQYELEVLAGLMKELPVYSVSRSDQAHRAYQSTLHGRMTKRTLFLIP